MMTKDNKNQGATEALLKRFTEWNTEVLLKLLRAVVAKREGSGKGGWDEDPEIETKEIISEEVVDVIALPAFNREFCRYPKFIDVDEQVAKQLKTFVHAIAQAYRINPYNDLQHASHTAMAAAKLISRVATSELEGGHWSDSEDHVDSEVLAAHIHTQTYGISSDPLTQFAFVLAALVHGVDHRGIDNEALATEQPELCKKYGGNAITEQLSFEKAWNKLMTPEFENLRRCIYADAEEKKRFRQVLVNSVLATARGDMEAQSRRQEMWDQMFGPGATEYDDTNRKATSVIECLMQASNEYHTMQHWHVYSKWNERNFEEAAKAYKEGRIPTDPAKEWYKTELKKFDDFIIPLTMQMKDIDAFVVSSDEYLNYALKNRQRWASNGREIVEALVAKYMTGSASAKADLIKAIAKEGADSEAKNETKARHLKRLVDWNNEVLAHLLKQIIAKREASGMKGSAGIRPEWKHENGKSIVNEVVDQIHFPAFDAGSSAGILTMSHDELDSRVATQLKEYVGQVSSKFRDNHFHCLDHASYVSIMAKRLLGRIVVQSSDTSPEEAHKQTFGLTSDPIAQFAVVFAALIHDVDHSGVPNYVLVEEKDELATRYQNRSVTQQHAIEVAWDQLMQPEFKDLVAAICSTETELQRFRQVVVKSVIATDYADDELVARRLRRWENAFDGENPNDNSDLLATIAVVLILQAADSFHAIQHWTVYKKWSERKFFEVFSAFESGRMKKDPSLDWYKNELAFLEDHIIPLCFSMKKLGVFGNSADEFFSFATTNKEKWAADGAEIVESMIAKYRGGDDDHGDRVVARLSLSASP